MFEGVPGEEDGVKSTGLEWTPEEDARLAHDERPVGAELVRVRTELLEIARTHCCAQTVEDCELLLYLAEMGT